MSIKTALQIRNTIRLLAQQADEAKLEKLSDLIEMAAAEAERVVAKANPTAPEIRR